MITFAGWVLDASIKGSILIVLVAAIFALAGSRFDPRWRHLLWVVVLVRLLIPYAPAASWSLYGLMPAQERMAAPEAAPPQRIAMPAFAPGRAEVVEIAPRQAFLAGPWLLGIWLTGVLLLAARTLVASIRTQLVVGRAGRRAAADPLLEGIVAGFRRELGIGRRVRIVESDLVRTPALHGLIRPVILLPAGLSASFSAAELRNVVLHELWHLRRLDVAVSWLLSAAQTLHWFNPLVWFAAARIREERELACDELALSLLEEEERTGYGMTILKLLERFRAPAPIPALIGIVNHKQKMKRRLTMIASFTNRARFSMLLLLTISTIAFAGLTDAREKRIVRKLDPAVALSAERLDQRVSLELANASFSDLLGAVATQAGLPITQAPETATNQIQQARFTLKAENVPLHALLGAALRPFQLFAEPEGNGVTIKPGEPRRRIIHKVDGGEPAVIGEAEHRVIVRRHKGEEAKAVLDRLESGELGTGKKVRIEVLQKAKEGASSDGKSRSELTFKFDEHGVKSEGRMTLEITK
ncbi:MAG TPA: M56 family metallopeptidase [Thermoanaerobaculia bacterium]|nr:M56 family metallopeptidase [Thermoanaerobaculia bacterium]